MSERARGAIFNMLVDVKGLVVLDAYAGSGALAIEAISRGAATATAIEIDGRAYRVLVNNLNKLALADRVTARRANVVSYLKSAKASYDLILLDPPYRLIKPEPLLAIASFLKPGGRLVVSYPANFELPFTSADWQISHAKTYAAANIVICQAKS